LASFGCKDGLMFDTILIANRGEIACRIMATAQDMGVRCVAVYSDSDAGAQHVKMADTAVHIGGSAPAQSYLRGDVIIEAALATGAQAVHPGYGFLSENPEFVEAVEAAGLVFIGPSASAIRAMGLKDAAKALMVEAGVPVVPGYHGSDQSDDLLAAEAAAMGYPVLIKAVAGGGGKGMRLVEAADGFAEALASARSEAMTAFGNSDVLVEKFVTHPRHIEVQVFGDGEAAVHLFERDCSLQRRHQKVIEEAPAPGMTEDVRAAMGAAAVKAAEAIGYSGAGTVEFIVDGSGPLRADGFWFMEMNTRLQVEHPVTEAVTGIDLVAWQLRVASGEALPLAQDQIALNGHAFEARLYAEDVPAGFLPSTGTLEHLQFPHGARADTGVRSGDAISPFYDPMIAKVITHGATRDVALAKMRRASSETQVAGSVTNLGFLHALCCHAGFRRGEVDTGLIARDLEALVAESAVTAEALAQAAHVSAGLDLPQDGTAAVNFAPNFTLWAPLRRQITLRCGGEDYLCHWSGTGDGAGMMETPLGSVLVERGADGWLYAGAPAAACFCRSGTVDVFGPAGRRFERVDPLDRASAGQGDLDVVTAPMPGLVKDVFVAPGDPVEAGMRLAILEAMKMEHSLLAARDGVVAEVLAPAGAQVEAGAALIRLEPSVQEDAA
jgi:3-methylcrotonyl-CoA carboxylase alpha subunit